MPKPLALCLEDLDSKKESKKYLQCSAKVGQQPGLRIRNNGDVSWEQDEKNIASEIWG